MAGLVEYGCSESDSEEEEESVVGSLAVPSASKRIELQLEVGYPLPTSPKQAEPKQHQLQKSQSKAQEWQLSNSRQSNEKGPNESLDELPSRSQAATQARLPPPCLSSCVEASGGVFSNPFQAERDAKLAALHLHVPRLATGECRNYPGSSPSVRVTRLMVPREVDFLEPN
uniref:uncharacterized protein isoform X2 n=1 Tax=Myxine glutinosa TaxID=7769 RepID=UPI00358DDE16